MADTVGLLPGRARQLPVAHGGSECGHCIGSLLIESRQIDLLVRHASGPGLYPTGAFCIAIDAIRIFVFTEELVRFDQRCPMLSQVSDISADPDVVRDGHDKKLS